MSEQSNNVATEKIKIVMVKHTEITNISKLAKATGIKEKNNNSSKNLPDGREGNINMISVKEIKTEKQNKVRYNITLSQDIHSKASELAKKNNMGFSYLCEILLKQFVENNE